MVDLASRFFMAIGGLGVGFFLVTGGLGVGFSCTDERVHTGKIPQPEAIL
jgi:hypothetical protein